MNQKILPNLNLTIFSNYQNKTFEEVIPYSNNLLQKFVPKTNYEGGDISVFNCKILLVDKTVTK